MSTVERGTIFNSPIYVYACTAIALCMFIMPFGVSDKFNAVQRIGLFKYASGLSDLKYSDVLDNSSRYQTSHSKRSIRMLDLILSIFIAPFVIVFTLYRLFVIYAYLLNN
ncbi:MAG: hypothetical protein LBU94_05785 [Clostridiales bacterium]|nr:hypothetical protein [Clostridiales bacterium]